MVRLSKSIEGENSLDAAIASLTSAAGVIDSLCATAGPSIELLEASLAIHKALVALVDSGATPTSAMWPAHTVARN